MRFSKPVVSKLSTPYLRRSQCRVGLRAGARRLSPDSTALSARRARSPLCALAECVSSGVEPPAALAIAEDRYTRYVWDLGMLVCATLYIRLYCLSTTTSGRHSSCQCTCIPHVTRQSSALSPQSSAPLTHDTSLIAPTSAFGEPRRRPCSRSARRPQAAPTAKPQARTATLPAAARGPKPHGYPIDGGRVTGTIDLLDRSLCTALRVRLRVGPWTMQMACEMEMHSELDRLANIGALPLVPFAPVRELPTDLCEPQDRL